MTRQPSLIIIEDDPNDLRQLKKPFRKPGATQPRLMGARYDRRDAMRILASWTNRIWPPVSKLMLDSQMASSVERADGSKEGAEKIATGGWLQSRDTIRGQAIIGPTRGQH